MLVTTNRNVEDDVERSRQWKWWSENRLFEYITTPTDIPILRSESAAIHSPTLSTVFFNSRPGGRERDTSFVWSCLITLRHRNCFRIISLYHITKYNLHLQLCLVTEVSLSALRSYESINADNAPHTNHAIQLFHSIPPFPDTFLSVSLWKVSTPKTPSPYIAKNAALKSQSQINKR